MPDSEDLPGGRRIPPHRKLFIIAAVFIQLAVIWPVYAFFSAAEPLVLGFPLSFAWLIFILLLAFAAMVYLYTQDGRAGLHDDDNEYSKIQEDRR
jgi:hypothetical protein